MVSVTLRGKVFSGVDEGSRFINLPWVRRQIIEKVGFNPYPGTLNLRLQRSEKIENLLKDFNGLKIEPAEGFYGGRCFKALIMGKINGAVVFPDSSRYPKNVLEVIAPFSLRKELRLKDGDEVEITVSFE